MCMDATWHWGAGYHIFCTLNRGRLRVRVLIMDSLKVALTALVCHVCEAHRFRTSIFLVHMFEHCNWGGIGARYPVFAQYSFFLFSSSVSHEIEAQRASGVQCPSEFSYSRGDMSLSHAQRCPLIGYTSLPSPFPSPKSVQHILNNLKA